MNSNTTNYEYLINKYSQQHPLEKRSREYETQKKQEQRTKRYLEIAEILMNPDNLNLKGDQRQHTYWIIKHIDLKQLNRKLSYEQIILGICWYVKKLFNSQARYEEYQIFKEYNLDLEQAYQILTRITSFAFNKSYLTPVLTDRYNHEELMKNGGKNI